MANEQNLMPIAELNARTTPEEKRANARKAGLASAKAKKQRRTFKESLEIILSMQATEEQKKAAEQFLTEEMDLTNGELVNLAMIGKAKEGDVKAAQFVRDTVGEMPTVKQEVTNTMSDGDKALLEKVSKRLEKSTGDGQKDSD